LLFKNKQYNDIIMSNQKITIITPATGGGNLNRLFESLDNQTIPWVHILLWDNKREQDYLYPNPITMKVLNPYDITTNKENCVRYSVVIPDDMVNGTASGSSLRAVGLMLANTSYVTFADSDVWFENCHLETLLKAIDGKNWAYCKRKIWTETEYIGVDDFESVGDSPTKKVPYEMVDNNCMIFARKFGVSGACLYRETTSYNDDRLYYAFLKKYAGEPGKTNLATVNQVCPQRLENMFKSYCTKGSNDGK
jgi:hypothetical protein